MRCPRRIEIPQYDADKNPDADSWRKQDGYDTCSFCGSLEPEAFLKAIQDGCQIDPTDKSYKLYVHLPVRNPELKVLSSTNRTEAAGYKSWRQLSREERKAVKRSSTYTDRKKWSYTFHTPEEAQLKFYTPHLSDEQGDVFRQLYTEKRINFGYPGRLYRPLAVPSTKSDD